MFNDENVSHLDKLPSDSVAEFRLGATSSWQETAVRDAPVRKRTLRTHISDESTCVPDSVAGLHDGRSEDTVSCTDTADNNSAISGRSHSRRSRIGRRAKARARQVQWLEAKQRSVRETAFEADAMGSLFGKLLTCIEEDAEHDVWMCREYDVQSDQMMPLDRPCECTDNDIEAGVEAEGLLGTQMIPHIQCREMNAEEDTVTKEGKCESISSACERNQDGATLVPWTVIQAISDYQAIIHGDSWNTVQDIRGSMEKLDKNHEKLEDAITYMDSWEGSPQLKSAWEVMDHLLVGSDEGPFKRYTRMRDDLDDAEEDDMDEDEIVELIGHHIEVAKEGCEKMVDQFRIIDHAEKCALAVLRQSSIHVGSQTLNGLVRSSGYVFACPLRC